MSESVVNEKDVVENARKPMAMKRKKRRYLIVLVQRKRVQSLEETCVRQLVGPIPVKYRMHGHYFRRRPRMERQSSSRDFSEVFSSHLGPASETLQLLDRRLSVQGYR